MNWFIWLSAITNQTEPQVIQVSSNHTTDDASVHSFSSASEEIQFSDHTTTTSDTTSVEEENIDIDIPCKMQSL